MSSLKTFDRVMSKYRMVRFFRHRPSSRYCWWKSRSCSKPI